MRIAIIADPFIPVPPVTYGGIERIIDMLLRGLIAQGYEITLFAHRDSSVPAHLIPYAAQDSLSKLSLLHNTWLITKELSQKPYDLVHSFGRLAQLLPVLPSKLPKVMSYQREPTLKGIQKAAWLSRKGSLAFTGCSEYITAKIRPFAPAYTIYNGVPAELYEFKASVPVDSPLVFLGRIEHIKGTHLAIELAKATQKRLIIAGNVPTDAESQTYFKTQIAPFIDGGQIVYIGPVNDAQKNELLGQAGAFLMPILWDEPFGIVMAEAMACGTPVIGMRRGSVPEVVQENQTGFIVDNLEQMIEVVKHIDTISRLKVRQVFMERFSASKIVGDYIQLYQQLVKP